MTFPTTFSTSEVLRLLGIKGGGIPTIDAGTMQPVIIMGDFSRSLSSEPFERRGFFAAQVVVPAAQFATIEMLPVGGGGAVIRPGRWAVG